MLTVSTHTHCESFLTSSTLPNLIERAKTLGRTHFTCTDHGYLHSSYKAYNAAKKAKLKPILGIELYVKDPVCPVVSGTRADRCKYFTLTAYAVDQEAYQQICKMVSRTDFQTIEIREETQNLFTWKDLEELSKYNIQIVLGGIHCLVGKAFLASDANIGLKLFEKLHALFPSKLFVAIIAEPWKKKFAKVVEIKYVDNTSDSLLASDTVSTDRARKIRASDLIDRQGHTEIKSKVVGGIYTEVDKAIESCRLHSGFLPLSCDVTLKINKFLVLLAKRYNIPVLVSDYAYYANRDDKIVQHVVLEGKDKIHANQHMKTHEEILDYLEKVMGLSLAEADKIVDNNTEWAKKFDNFELKYEWRLASTDGQGALKKAMEIIKRNGRMKWDNPIYVVRLKEELEVIVKNPVKNLIPYFLPLVDIAEYCDENKILRGVARGSAGGSLLCFLLGITNLDPIKWDLSFSRFLSLDRIKNGDIPDVDCDYPQKDKILGANGKGGYIYERWGNRAAQVSTRTLLRLKSSIKDVERYFDGKVSKNTETFCQSLLSAPQGVSDKDFVFGFDDKDSETHVPGLLEVSEELQNYKNNNPDRWAIVEKSLGITRAFSVHASAVCIADAPISTIVPTKEEFLIQYEAKEAESSGLVKYDILSVSQLKDIELCIELINKKNNENCKVGEFTHKGDLVYIWDLPNESEVFRSIWNGDTETIFQLNTKSMAPFVKDILPTNIEDISVILAIVRPGTLDFKNESTGRNMAEEYVARRKGESEPDFKELADILPETYGIIVFQEQQLKIAKEVGGMNSSEAEKLRRFMSKKQKKSVLEMKPVFMGTAISKLGKEKAEELWNTMETFSRYSFNCIDGDQLIITDRGLTKMSDIALNYSKYSVKTADLNGDFCFETPIYGCSQGIKEVLTVELSDGSFVRATGDHKFLSNGEWKTLEEIIKNNFPIDTV